MSSEKTAEQIQAEILAVLPEHLKKAYLGQQQLQRQQMIRGALAQVFHRNFSHNLGSKLRSRPGPKKNGSF